MKAKFIACKTMDDVIKVLQDMDEESKELSEEEQKLNELYERIGDLFQGQTTEDVLRVLCMAVLATINIYAEKAKSCESSMILTFVQNLIRMQRDISNENNNNEV